MDTLEKVVNELSAIRHELKRIADKLDAEKADARKADAEKAASTNWVDVGIGWIDGG